MATTPAGNFETAAAPGFDLHQGMAAPHWLCEVLARR